MTATSTSDRLIIAGGGLAGCLAALAIAERRPEVPLLLVEGGERLGGNHVWSFFGSDVAAADEWLVEPLVSARWVDHEVRFPAHRRVLPQSYQSIRSERLDEVVRARLGPERLRLGTTIARVEPRALVTGAGERIEGRGVIDARGAADLSALELGWQKFVGADYRFEAPHGITRPVIMDATVEQLDGYRFVYLLPFSDRDLLVEDTYYSDGPDLDVATLRARIGSYVSAAGLPRAELVREETGVLPVTIGGDFAAFQKQADAAAIGMRGGFFHPTTGYSLPDAVRVASFLVQQTDLSGEGLRTLLATEARRLWRRRGFYRMLNTMLFHAAKPPERYKVLERFYRLSPALVGRFYAGQSTLLDQARILTGRPPVPVGRALKALAGRRGR